MTLVQNLALSTTTFFQFEPKDEDIKDWYIKDCKKNKTKAMDFPKDKSTSMT